MPPPPQLEPLTAVLPKLDLPTFEAALRAAALDLQQRREEIDADGIMAGFAAAGVTSGQKKILSACGYLMKQAGKGGGLGAEKLSKSLGPMGFEEAHIEALISTLEWVKNGSAVAPKAQPARAAALEGMDALGVSEGVPPLREVGQRQFTLLVQSEDRVLLPEPCQCTVNAGTLVQLCTAIKDRLALAEDVVVLTYDEDFEEYVLPSRLSDLKEQATVQVKRQSELVGAGGLTGNA